MRSMAVPAGQLEVETSDHVILRYTLAGGGNRGFAALVDGALVLSVAASLGFAAAEAPRPVVGVLALTESQSLRARRDDVTNPDRFLITDADNQRVRSLALTADILFGGAVLFGATAFTLAFLTDWGGARPGPTITTGPQVRLTPAFGRTAAGLSLSGSF